MARRISVPITLTAALVATAIALTVGWQILVAREFQALREGFGVIHWVLFTLGTGFFALIITVAVLQAVWLVREMRTNLRQRDFIDAVTHELHTPLSSLRLYIDTLSGQTLDEAQRREFLDIMRTDLERLQRTIGQILQAARSEVRPSRGRSIDLSRLLEECVGEARDRHGLDEHVVSLQLRGTAWVRGDLEQLRVAFRNLIENAIRYGGSKARVDVRMGAASSRRLRIEVEDQGHGIPQQSLRSIFQRFQRLSYEGVRAAAGLGLGLYIVRNVVRAHGGSVRAESDGLDQGSRFIVTLPGQLDGSTHPAR